VKSLIATLNIYPGTAWMSYFELNGVFNMSNILFCY